VVYCTNYEDENPVWTNEQGWIAVARGCRKLTTISTSLIAGWTETALLAFAAHCPELEVLLVDGCKTTFSDAVLLALANGCPKLLKLKFDRWAIKSLSAVDTAQQLLSRLECCPDICCTASPPAVLARAVSYLRSVKDLCLSGIPASYIRALNDCTMQLPKCETLSMSGMNGRVAVDDFLVAVAAGSAHLHSIYLHRGTRISASALIRVAKLCPRIQLVRIVDCDFGGAAEEALCTLVRSWRHLQEIEVGGNELVSDAVLQAIALHCPRMSELDLFESPAVTEAALLEAVNMLPACRFVIPCAFNKETSQRVDDAIRRATAGARPRPLFWATPRFDW
jgi:hypothetical protein